MPAGHYPAATPTFRDRTLHRTPASPAALSPGLCIQTRKVGKSGRPMKAELLALLREDEQTVRSMVLTIMGVAKPGPILSTRCQAQMDLHFLRHIFKQFLLGIMP